MSVEIRIADRISDEEREQLFGWGADVFGALSLNLRWRPKDWHVLVYAEGRAVSHVGLLAHTLEVGGRRVRVGGVGAVVSAPSVQGRGFATRALRLASDFAFSGLGTDRIELYAEPDNVASRGVARNAGFVEEGLLRRRELTETGERRDMVLYARLDTDAETAARSQ